MDNKNESEDLFDVSNKPQKEKFERSIETDSKGIMKFDQRGDPIYKNTNTELHTHFELSYNNYEISKINKIIGNLKKTDSYIISYNIENKYSIYDTEEFSTFIVDVTNNKLVIETKPNTTSNSIKNFVELLETKIEYEMNIVKTYKPFN